MSDSAFPTPPCPSAWPDPGNALDESLDRDGVMASTGCTAEDLVDLKAIFLQEQANMTARLAAASQALDHTDPASDEWPAAVEALRTAAHELTTSFGILGARCAEHYARETQKRLRRSAAVPQTEVPTAEQTRTCSRALDQAVKRVADLIQRGG